MRNDQRERVEKDVDALLLDIETSNGKRIAFVAARKVEEMIRTLEKTLPKSPAMVAMAK